LRIGVKDMRKINVASLKALGASGVLQVGNNAQAIFGPRSENLKTDMVEYLKTAGPEADEVLKTTPTESETVVETLPKIEADPAAVEKAKIMLAALGGINNIRAIDPVALTRLRIEVTDADLIDETTLQSAGVKAIMRVQPQVLHVIVGLNCSQYAHEMNERLRTFT